MTRSVVIVDYGVGNVFSIHNALERIGVSVKLASNQKEIESAEHLILPGVGSFPEAIKNLRHRGIYDSVQSFIASGRPLLGICLGMQLLMDRSNENGNHSGFGVFEGTVERIDSIIDGNKERIKIPHIGWNNILYNSASHDNILKDIGFDGHYYFVHSYACRPKNSSFILAHTNYQGIMMPAVIACKNILGLQFHPEKSGPDGLRLLKKYFCSHGALYN